MVGFGVVEEVNDDLLFARREAERGVDVVALGLELANQSVVRRKWKIADEFQLLVGALQLQWGAASRTARAAGRGNSPLRRAA